MGLFRLCLLLVLLGTTSPAAEVEPRGVRPGRLADLQGEIVEVGCYLRDGHRGEAHKGCALACLQNGGQLGLLEDDSGVLSDRWRFDGHDWLLVEQDALPRSGHATTYVQDVRRRFLSFGGDPAARGSGAPPATFERTRDARWLEHATVDTPAARTEATIFEEFAGAPGWGALMFGGRDASGRGCGIRRCRIRARWCSRDGGVVSGSGDATPLRPLRWPGETQRRQT